MSASEAHLESAAEIAAEAARVVSCSQEPVRTPGAIQPHGALLAIDPTTSSIVQVSDNTSVVLGRSPADLLGSRLDSLLDAESHRDVMLALDNASGDDRDAVAVRIGPLQFEAIVHRSPDRMVVVELEPADETVADRTLAALHAATQRLIRARTIGELRAVVVSEVRAMTGFDRVMIYHFHPDGHGEVVAEDVADGLPRYLGLHFPGSDIPLQARELYVEQATRAIPTNDYRPAMLTPRDNPTTSAPTDLSLADLRSVSPHHLEFMKNMGAAAAMSVSMVHDGRLIGMISCNHSTPHRVPYSLRRGCETMARQITLQVRVLDETQQLTHRLQLQPVRTRLLSQVGDGDDIGEGLVAGTVTLLDLVAADGAIVRIDGRFVTVADTPPDAEITALLALLDAQATPSPAITDALNRDRPDLAAAVPSVAGLVVLPLGAGGDCLVWFRRPIAQDVHWLGEQSPANRPTARSPRSSFSRWRQTVTDRSLPWLDAELDEAAELARDLSRLIAQAGVRRAQVNAALVASVASGLAETLDAHEAANRLVRLVVPALADWAVVTLVDDADHPPALRHIQDVASWHRDPGTRALAARYASARMDSLQPGSFLERAFATGELVTRRDGATAAIEGVLKAGQARSDLHELAPESFAVVPLLGRTRVLGLISLFNGRSRGASTPDELSTAHEVASRAGVALDNARLYRQQRHFAETMQRSLLTEPAQSDHLQIVVRYVPAAEAAKVGGDWYDAFTARDGSTTVVIGDVAGHDTSAAAGMGQLRSLMRGIAVATGAGPADLLRLVDTAMATLDVPTIATAVVARLEQSDDERRRGATRVTWSNAGHPHPVLISSGGLVSMLARDRPDMLLGVRADAHRTELTITLERGATLLLYTDGLVERRTQTVQAGTATLLELLGTLSDLDLDSLIDETVAHMVPSRPEDDVALLAVRLLT